MTQKVLALQNEFRLGKVTIALDAMNFLQSWLTKHIMKTDFKYGPHLKSKGVEWCRCPVRMKSA
jgi:hemerythrin